MSTIPLAELGVTAYADIADLEMGMKRAADSVNKVGSAANRQQAQLDKLVAAIDPVTAAYARFDKMQEQLNQHAAKGFLDPARHEDLTRKLVQQRFAFEEGQKQMQGNAKTARELSFALRNLPAQFTDIAVSLQAGQAPLTVLLQQGGQLKDMFGGIGPAAKVMGNYILGLVTNPMTLLAGSIIAVTVGFAKAIGEMEKFNKAIVTTGNQAGVTSGQLNSMANSIDKVVGTQSNAASVLTKLTSTGKISGDQLERVAIATIEFQRATGTAIDDIIEGYTSLSEKPLEALVKLNESQGFLTSEQYKTVEALQQSGDAAGATAAAIDILVTAQSNVAQEIQANESNIVWFFRTLKDLVFELGDSLIGVARNISPTMNEYEERLAKINELRDEEIRKAEFYGRTLSERRKRELDEQEAVIQGKIEELRLQEEAARTEAESAATARAAFAARQQLSKLILDASSDAEKLAAKYIELDRLFEAAAKGGFEYTEAQIQLLRQAAMEGFLPKDLDKVSEAADNLLQKAKEQEAILLAQGEASKTLTQSQKELLKFESQIAAIKSKDIKDADDQAILAQEEQIRNQLELNVSIENGLEYKEQQEKTLAEFDKIYKSLLTKEETSVALTLEKLNALEAARSAGLDQVRHAEALNRILKQSFDNTPNFDDLLGRTGNTVDDRFAKANRELDTWYASQLDKLEQFREERADLEATWNAHEERINREYHAKAAALEEARLNQRSEAFEEFAKEAARNIQDAFADFLFDPFDEGLEGMVKGFANAMRRMIAEATAAKALEWAAGSSWGKAATDMFSDVFGGGKGGASGLNAIPGMSSILKNNGIDDIIGAFQSYDETGARVLDKGLLMDGFKQLGLTIGATWAGSKVGTAIGESLFNKQAESNIGQTIGSTIGSIWGPWGAAIGSALGSLVDVATGGDGYIRQNAGFFVGNTPGAKPEYTFNVDPFASGLNVQGFARREDQETARQIIEQFRQLDEFFVQATKAMGGILEVTSLAGLNEEATQGSKGTFLGLGRDADLPAQLKMFIDQLADNMKGLDQALIDSIKNADDAQTAINILADAVERYARIQAMQGLASSLIAIDLAKQEFAAQKGLVAVFEQSSSAVKTLSRDYQGTIEQTTMLSDAILAQQEAVFNLTMAYLQAQVSVEQLFGNLSESIRKSLMGQEELYNYERDQVRALTALLDTLTDPEAILATAQDIERRVSEMWGRLDETQRAEMGAGFLAYLDDVEQLAQTRLEEGLAEVEDAQQSLNEILLERIDVISSTLNAVGDKFTLSSDVALQAAYIDLQASNINMSNSNQNRETR